MRRKRYTKPEVALQRLIADLEDEVKPGGENRKPSPHDPLRQFLRDIVNGKQAQISTSGPVTFAGRSVDGRIRIAEAYDGPGGGNIRDLVVVRFVMLVHDVGLHNIRSCQAPAVRREGVCDRLFVRHYRQEFCSPQCQQRTRKRIVRQEERKELEQREIRARRRRVMKGGR